MTKTPGTEDVREKYASVARSQLSNDSAAVRSVAMAFGYSEEELATLPTEANMGVSCGNPLALAGVREGEVVVDLGCGGGMDIFLASRKVGETGKAIGIDMTDEMLERARNGAQKQGLTNVEFYKATIDQLPLADNSVDCIISNCVINLVPDKPAVFREIMRVLKPGGRVAVSDLALKTPLPQEVKESVEAYVGCIAGAIHVDDYQKQLADAGFESITITDTGADLNAYAQASSEGDCCGPSESSCCEASLHDNLASIIRSIDINHYAASVRVHAIKGPQPSTTTGTLPTASVNTADAPKTEPQNAPESSSATANTTQQRRTVRIYDRAMCCSTGVCGPQVDPVLPKFAADLEWLQQQGHDVQRYNLSQDAGHFASNPVVQSLLTTEGVECLPLVMVDGNIVSRSEYPSRENLALWTGTSLSPTSALPMVDGGCCGGSSCC